MNRILSRKRVSSVAGRHIFGHLVRAGSIQETEAGFDAVLVVEGYTSVRSPGHAAAAAARAAIELFWDPTHPDFIVPSGWQIEEPEPIHTGAKVKAKDTSEIIRGRRTRGSTEYVIIGETIEEVEEAIASICAAYLPGGYGTSFGEIERVDGVYRSIGRRSNSCD